MTDVGAKFFKDFHQLKVVIGGKDLKKFGEKAFYHCMSLEKIVIENPDFDLNSLTNNSVIYQMALDENGKFFMIPSIQVSGYTENLWGKKSLDTKSNEWELIGPLAKQDLEDLKAGGVYHFFQTRLEKTVTAE